MAMKRKNRREHGQVIYLLAVGIITLLGFTALAIDGARLFSERRNAQGVADTAAFTAAAYIGQYTLPYIQSNWYTGAEVEPHAEQAALDRIRSNGYTDPLYNPWTGNDRLRITIDPFTEGMATKYIVKVFLISEIEPIFAQVIYNGPMLVNVEAQAVVMPRTNLGFGQAMVALSTDECNALQFTGGSEIDIIGSGIFSNSDCEPNAINFTGGTDVDVTGDLITPGDYDVGGGSSISAGGIDTDADQQAFPNVPTPDCSGLVTNPTNIWYDKNTLILNPGRYTYKLMLGHAKTYNFLPGLYCLEKGLVINGGASQEVNGTDVMFYIKSGNVLVSSGILNLTAPDGGEADDGTNSWNGMLFYVNRDTIDLQPSPGTYLEGTIYAPSDKINPTCKLTGNGDTEGYNLQLVCNTITLAGGANLYIDFDNSNAYEPPISIDLVQ
jgi:hypothetical protein